MRFIIALVFTTLLCVTDAMAAPTRVCLKDATGKITIRKKCPAKKGFSEVNAEVLQGLGASQVGPQGPAGSQGPAGEVGPAGPSGLKYFAVVSSNGTLERGGGVASVVRNGTGNYNVDFSSDIGACIAHANVGGDEIGYIPAFLSTGIFATQNRVRVRIYNHDGTAFDRPFYLSVLC